MASTTMSKSGQRLSQPVDTAESADAHRSLGQSRVGRPGRPASSSRRPRRRPAARRARGLPMSRPAAAPASAAAAADRCPSPSRCRRGRCSRASAICPPTSPSRPEISRSPVAPRLAAHHTDQSSSPVRSSRSGGGLSMATMLSCPAATASCSRRPVVTCTDAANLVQHDAVPRGEQLRRADSRQYVEFDWHAELLDLLDDADGRVVQRWVAQHQERRGAAALRAARRRRPRPGRRASRPPRADSRGRSDRSTRSRSGSRTATMSTEPSVCASTISRRSASSPRRRPSPCRRPARSRPTAAPRPLRG